MLSAVISAFLYLRIVLTMYGDDVEEGEGAEAAPAGPRIRVPVAAGIALAVAVVATLGIGLVPDPLTKTARDATPVLVAEHTEGN
jgi:NADH:ubiquinone oxidoreductase subunit 2 (subunit N)